MTDATLHQAAVATAYAITYGVIFAGGVATIIAGATAVLRALMRRFLRQLDATKTAAGGMREVLRWRDFYEKHRPTVHHTKRPTPPPFPTTLLARLKRSQREAEADHQRQKAAAK